MTIIETEAAAPRKRPKDRREQILRAAYELIAESGFNAVSLADVARASGISKSSVLHHFPSMNDLLLGVLQLREAQDYEFYMEQPPAADADPRTARERFTRVFLHNLERPQFVRLYVILSAEALAAEHPAHEYVLERARSARAEVAASLSWKRDPQSAAVELIAFWNGLELAWTQDEHLDPRVGWENFCDRFFVADPPAPARRSRTTGGRRS